MPGIENQTLGNAGLGRYWWEAELTKIDGETHCICTRSYVGFQPSQPFHYMVHYPHEPLLCLTRFRGLVSYGHHINPETGIQFKYEWHKRSE